MILDAFGNPVKSEPAPRRSLVPGGVRASWDAAQTTDENRKHWSRADDLTPDAAANPAVRRTLRKRARYEVANNTYAKGISQTVVDWTIGSTIRLQLTGAVGRSQARREGALTRQEASLVEGEFFEWMEANDIFDKVGTMVKADSVDGEAFGIMQTNPNGPSQVKLDLALVEADNCTSPFGGILTPTEVDGIRFDDYGNPLEYSFVDPRNFLSFGPPQVIPACDVIHLFKAERPGQRRGVSEFAPALPLFAQLRRWTLAVLAAAESAADFAGIMQSDQGPDVEDVDDSSEFARVELERRALLTLPAGWKLAQLKAEHPNGTYAEAKREIVNEIARCWDMPYNLAAGNSSTYNYASGRLDHQSWAKSVRVRRRRVSLRVLDRLFAAWRREAILIEGYLPQPLRTVTTNWSHQWFFEGWGHVDPVKEATAAQVRLQSNTDTLADIWGAQGADWEDKLEQIARERALMKDLGITAEEIVTAPSADDEDAMSAFALTRDDAGRISGVRRWQA